MSNTNYHPTGDLQGDSKAMPDKGTGTGMNGDTYGADLSVDSTNSQGSAKSKGDAMDRDMPNQADKL